MRRRRGSGSTARKLQAQAVPRRRARGIIPKMAGAQGLKKNLRTSAQLRAGNGPEAATGSSPGPALSNAKAASSAKQLPMAQPCGCRDAGGRTVVYLADSARDCSMCRMNACIGIIGETINTTSAPYHDYRTYAIPPSRLPYLP